MRTTSKAYLIGGGIGSLAAAAFMIRDGGILGTNILILDAAETLGGSLDAGGTPQGGYSLRGGRMLTTDNYECTWALFKSIPSLSTPGISVYDETRAFNDAYPSHALARLVDSTLAKVPAVSMGFSMQDRIELLKLAQAEEHSIGATCITDWLSPHFFQTPFWLMWSTTFAFQPWHSATEFRRYLHRFMLEFSRIDTLAGVKRTVFNQYDSLVLPLQSWLTAQGVRRWTDCTVLDLEHQTEDGWFNISALHCLHEGVSHVVTVNDGDLVFLQNGSMTDASSLGSMTDAPQQLSLGDSIGWHLWEKLATDHPEFGRPAVFNADIARSCWESFTVTLPNTAFFDAMTHFTGNAPGTGGLVTFTDSNWRLSIVLPHQPHFRSQPDDVQVFWGYALFPERIGNYVAKPMADCNGEEILHELCGHLCFDHSRVHDALCIPCRMPFITSMFMPRAQGDRPLPVPPGSENFAFISQFVEISEDVVFTVEYSIRAAQTAVYQLLALPQQVPPVTRHDRSLHTQFETLLKAMT